MTTDISTSPYYDDFDPAKKFVKILFKPGYAVQARELTQLQTGIQAQIERFGNHVFQHGSMVVPGNSYTDFSTYYAKLSLTTTSIAAFTVGSEIVGGTNGVKAIIKFAVAAEGSDPPTIYFNYTSGGVTSDVPNGINTFALGENIYLSDAVDNTAAILATAGSLGNGTLAYVGNGVYYVNGYFAAVQQQVIVIDKYDTFPTCRVGLFIEESIVTSNTDDTLLDPAQGSYNYAAPGADRLALTLTLKKYSYYSTPSEDFIELMRYNAGELEEHTRFPKYSELDKSLAKRTFEESGNYRVNGLNIFLYEHKKTLLSEGVAPNNGLFTNGFISKFVVAVSPGRAYVNGFGIDKVGTTKFTFDKARDSTCVIQKSDVSIRPSYGQSLYVSDITGGAIDFNSRPSINLYLYGTTTIIGTAKIYTIDQEYGSGSTRVFSLSFYDLSLNTGYTLANAGGFALTSNISVYGKICQKLKITNPVVDFAVNSVITYNSTVRNATVEAFDRSTLSLYVYRHSATLTPIRGDYIVSGTSNATVLDVITTINNSNKTAIVQLPFNYVKSVKNATNTTAIKYYIWKHLQIITDASGDGSISVAGGEQVFAIEDGTFIALNSTGIVSNTLFSLNPAQTTLSIVGGPALSTIIISCIVEKDNIQERIKTLTSYTHTTTVTGVNSVITLPHRDIYRVSSVILDPSGTPTDITRFCKFDSGQRDYTYEFGKITYLETLSSSLDVAITYTYFAHSTGDYFSIDSYTATLGDVVYDELPEYATSSGTTVDLKNCLDFRYTGATSGMPVTSYSITTDLQYFVGYYILAYLDNKNVNFIKGVPADNPKLPKLPLSTLKIGSIYVPPYTNSLRNARIKEDKNYRYTMADIATLDARIENVEYFSLLTMKEKGLVDFSVIDASTGLDRYKTGLVVEEFANQLVSSDMTNSDNRISYLASGITAPVTGSQNSVSVTDLSSNTTTVDTDKKMIAYNEVEWAGNKLSSGTENLNPYLVFNWYGNMKLVPNFDSFVNTVSLSSQNNMSLTNTVNVSTEQTTVILNPAPPANVVTVTIPAPEPAPIRLIQTLSNDIILNIVVSELSGPGNNNQNGTWTNIFHTEPRRFSMQEFNEAVSTGSLTWDSSNNGWRGQGWAPGWLPGTDVRNV